MKKHILVSGASGFLGNEVVRQLVNDTTYQVIALSSNPEKLKDRFQNAQNLTVHHINNWTEEIDKNAKVDICINCAFPRSSKPTALAEGLAFTEEFIADVMDANIPNIINISSQSVYSQKEKTDTDETAEVSPENLYGMAKYASERLVSALTNRTVSKVNAANIRLASLTGRDFDVRMTNRFVKQAIEGETITVNGGAQKIAYLDVRDAASALLAMIQTPPETWKDTYNLGNKYNATVLEISKTVETTAKEYGIDKVDIQINPGSDNFNNLIDSSQFYQDFNWEPTYTIPLMIEDLFNYKTSAK